MVSLTGPSAIQALASAESGVAAQLRSSTRSAAGTRLARTSRRAASVAVDQGGIEFVRALGVNQRIRIARGGLGGGGAPEQKLGQQTVGVGWRKCTQPRGVGQGPFRFGKGA